MALVPYADEDPRDDRVRGLLKRMSEPKINLFRMLANAPALAGPALRLGQAILTRSELDVHLRELVILHTARVTGTEYEWEQHEEIARLVGVSAEKVRAVDEGAIAEGDVFGRPEALALKLVSELLASNGTPPPELVKAVEAELGRAQLIEVMLVAGFYAMLGGVMRAVELDVDNVVEKGMLDDERMSSISRPASDAGSTK